MDNWINPQLRLFRHRWGIPLIWHNSHTLAAYRILSFRPDSNLYHLRDTLTFPIASSWNEEKSQPHRNPDTVPPLISFRSWSSYV
jgi:hypothetical protein